MTIKQQGGIFGRNPTFNNVEASEIIATNNLGINTSSPQRPLDVLAGSFNTGVAHFSGSFSDRGLFLSTDVSGTRNDGAVKYDASSGASGSFGQHQFLTDGGLVATIKSVGIALENGKGIDFSATSGTGTSELFDDYEEGTWTPVVADAISGGNEASTSSSVGVYTKIGNAVFVHCSLNAIDTTGLTGANDIYIRGLPFAGASGTIRQGSCVADNTTFTGQIAPQLAGAASFFRIRETASGSAVDYLTVSELTSGTADLWISLAYEVA